jgi:Protein of unknown function (DUF3703)
MSNPFASNIRPSVQAELDAAAREEAHGEFAAAFGHLERAHVLGQAATREHVRVHWAMWQWARRRGDRGEALGQLWRTAAAACKTWLWVPAGNTGGANVSGLQRMPIPADLQRRIDAARGLGPP